MIDDGDFWTAACGLAPGCNKTKVAHDKETRQRKTETEIGGQAEAST
jgi:hypothetical protein